ncbi:MAG: class I SAM-dependent methyltransferase [Rhodothermales bacterium]
MTSRGPINASYLFAGQELAELLPGGALYDCPVCSLAFRYPTPPKEKLDALYRSSPIGHWQYDPALRHDWVETRAYLQGNVQGGSLLDIGCFDGAFHAFMGPAWEAYGVEINLEARERARQRGVSILGSDAGDLAAIDRSFDAVVAFDVLEHVVDPRGLLALMARRTRSGGAVIIASGDADAWSWRLMGSRYWYCTIPEHMAFLSETWCRKAGDHVGLQLAHIGRYSHERFRTPRLVAHELASNLLYRFLPGVFAWLRSKGVGDKDPGAHEELKRYPPTWTTARDHVVAIYRKP